MTKLSFSIKSLFFTIIIGLSLLLGTNAWAFASFLSLPHNQTTSAVSSQAIRSEAVSGFTNSDFELGSGSSRPQSPSNWSVIQEENNPKTPEANGLISLNTTEFQQNKADYELDDYNTPPTNSVNNNALMINGNDTSLYYGYQANSTITLNANSYYQISVQVYTDNDKLSTTTIENGAIASVYLSGEDFDNLETAKITRINTQRQWATAVFYVATSTTKNSTVNLQLYLGQKAHTDDKTAVTSNGFVLFDNVNVTPLSGEEFANLTTANNLGQFSTVVELDDTQLISSGAGYVENGNFASLENWTDMENSSNGEIQFVEHLAQNVNVNGTDVVFGTHKSRDGNGTSGVVISANNGFAGIKSADIEIKQHQIYRITFWAKGQLDSGSLNFSLGGILPETNYDEDDENASKSANITSLSSSSSAINGGWSLYEFYVVGHPLSDCTVNLTLGIGTKSASATGYVAISDIKSYLVTTEQMKNGQELNSEAQTLEMYPTSTYTFNNFSFNFVEIDSLNENLSYPLQPLNWTQSNPNNTTSGVVQLSKDTSSKDNVLKLQTANDYQGYTSESVSLSSDAYARITVEAYIPTLNSGSAYITIQNANSVVLAQYKISNITSGWTTYSFYLHNYNASQNLTATLSLGNENETSKGRAFFDNCIIVTDLTEDDFNAVTASETIQKIDLNSNLLDVTTPDSTTPLYWDLNTVENESNSTINSGIINAGNWERYPFLNANPESPATDDETLSNNILVINSSSPVYAYYASKLSYTFTAETYYKVSVYVKTTDLTVDDESEYTEDGQQLLHGASIILTNIDSSFTAINTNTNKDDATKTAENEWVEYIMYIYTTSDTTSTIQLGLGSENMPTAGYAYFSNMTISTLTEDEYNLETMDYDPEDEESMPSNVLLATNVPEESTDDETTTTPFGSIDPFAISTIIIAVAIVIAVVGVFVKRFYKAHPKKVEVVNSNDYDRLQTLLKDVDRRERKTAINHKIKLLQEELAQSQKFLAEEMDELKKQTDSFNTAKEIAKDSPNVKLEAPNVKQIQKEIQTQTLKIQEIQIDLQLLEEERDRINAQTKREIAKSEEQAKINKEKLAQLNKEDNKKDKLNKYNNKKRK